MAANPAHLSPALVRPTLAVWGLLVAAFLMLGGCRPSVPPQADNTAPPLVEPTPDSANPEPPTTEPALAPTPAATSAPTTAAPTTATATLPNNLIKEWQPLSNVLLAFGPMTLTPDQVQWESGQTSPYSLISTEGGYLLKLEANPQFYDNQNSYIKLIPKAGANGSSASIEIAFYTNEAQLQSNEYIMYGSYFAE